jgi:tRNA pseudouridine38/39 synthase
MAPEIPLVLLPVSLKVSSLHVLQVLEIQKTINILFSRCSVAEIKQALREKRWNSKVHDLSKLLL